MKVVSLATSIAVLILMTAPAIAQEESEKIPRVDRWEEIMESLDLSPKEEPEVEFRGLWVNSKEIDSDEDLIATADVIENGHFNALVTYGPWGQIDKLMKIMDERGVEIQVHAWRSNMKFAPPKEEWALVDASGEIPRGKTGEPEFNDMARPEIREWHIEKMLEPMEERDYVTGAHFDYIRYPNWRVEDRSWRSVGNRFCYCDFCRTEFEKEYGYDPIVFASSKHNEGIKGNLMSGQPLSVDPRPLYHEDDSDFIKEHQHEWDEWRKRQITKLVKGFHEVMKEKFPNKAITAAVFRNSTYQQQVLQDAFKWLNEGWIDVAMPMNYTEDHEFFLRSALDFMDRTDESVHHRIFPGIGAHKIVESGGTPEDLVKQIRIVRELGHKGFVIFQVRPLSENPGYVKALAEGPCKKVVEPYSPW